MSILPPDLAKLTAMEKVELIDLLWLSMSEDDFPLTDAQRQDLEKRIAEDQNDPDEGRPWEEVKAELLGQK
ncbi:MAG TPA: addiction module protein [Gemmataceae bacterium]|jgi:putative addiction module component (TIGR02574 family)|nr:addiction module protein [Gemmataceae bacterium]